MSNQRPPATNATKKINQVIHIGLTTAIYSRLNAGEVIDVLTKKKPVRTDGQGNDGLMARPSSP